MTQPDHRKIAELEQDDKLRTRRERTLTAAIFSIGLILALVIGYEVTATDEGIRTITCEDGDVTLVLEHADGEIERVECPVDVLVAP